jgi:hypothetical protein
MLSDGQEAQVVTLLDHGVERKVVAAVFGVSVRTASRAAALERARTRPQTLDELLRSLPTLDDVLAECERPSPGSRRSRRRPAWAEAAAQVETMEREAAELGLHAGGGDAAHGLDVDHGRP